MATEHSDLDVWVVLTDEAEREHRTTRTTAVDEFPVAMSELEDMPPYGTEGWWSRWSFAWAPTLLDRTAAGSPRRPDVRRR